jgi:translocation and assembly module TamB
MKWRGVVGWTFVVVGAVVLIAVIGGYSYLKTDAFRHFAMRKIIEQTNEATGGHMELQGFDFQLSTLTAHLYGIVVHGKEAASDPPLLAVDSLTVRLKILSVLQHKVTLRELLIDHPVAYVQVNKKGQNNFPQAPAKKSNSKTDLFDLAVGHVGLTRGEVNYKDRKMLVDGDLHNFTTDVTFDSLQTRYIGSISYDNGHLRYGDYAPLPHSLAVKFNAGRSEFALESAALKIGSSSASLRANVKNYDNPAISGDYNIRLHTDDFAAMSPAARPSGDVVLIGKIGYQNNEARSALRNAMVDGQVASDVLSAAASGRQIEIRKLRGQYRLADGTFRANGVSATLLGGQINTDLEMRNLDQTPASRVRAALRNISLSAAKRMAQQPELNRVALLGSLNGTINASWTGSTTNLRAKSDLFIRANGKSTSPSSREIPLNGVIHAEYDNARSTLVLRETTLRIPSASVTANGEVSQRSSLQIQAVANDLHQLIALASSFSSQPSAPPAVSGSATFNASIRGSMQAPQISGQLSAQNLEVQGSKWRSAGLSLQAGPSQVSISNGSLVAARQGRASFDANIRLRSWSYAPSDPIQAHLTVTQMPVTDLQHLANVRYPVSGDLSANVSLSGSQLDPKGSGSLKIANARAYDEPIQKLAMDFHAQNGSIVSTLNVGANAGSVTTNVSFTPKTKAYKVSLDAPEIVLQKLHAVQAKNLAMNGTLSISAQGQGTLDNPQMNALVQLPHLAMRDKSINGVKAEVRLANQQADLTLDSQVMEASIRARGHVNLTGDYEANATFDTSSVPLDALLAAYTTVPPEFKGQTELHATLRGPLKDKTRLEAHLTIPTLNASYQSLQIGAARPIRADYLKSVLTIQPSEIRGTGTSLRFQGSVPLAGNGEPTLMAQGSIDAQILRIANPDLQSSGTVALDVRTSGSDKGPQVRGQVRLQKIDISTATAPLGFHNLNGALDISNDRVQISNVKAQVGGGELLAGGSITYRPNVQFNVALDGKSVRLRYPEGLRTVLDSSLAWTGNMESSTLSGRVLIGALSFTPEFDLASFGDQFSASTATPAEPGLADTINLQIAVQSKGTLTANTSQLSIEGDADLRVGGTAANPVITGRTDLNAGELFYRNVRYELQRGVISFDNPAQTRPVLNMSVATKVEQYDLTINLRGPFETLTVAYSSDPPLATADVINLIARGKTTSESAAPSSQSTDSMVASQAVGQVSGGLQKLAGLSSLQIDPTLSGPNHNPGARIALQQRVTKNFLFTFSTDVSEPGNELVQGDYRLTKRWSVSVARTQQGGVSVDGRFHTKF